MTIDGVAERLREKREQIDQAARAAGRRPEEITLLLATKTVAPELIGQALAAGVTNIIGENRVQELVGKAEALQAWPHEAHFIGHLQRNKINQVLRVADCVQSVDSVQLAAALASRVEVARPDAVPGAGPGAGPTVTAAQTGPLDVFVQVNTSGEESKYGCRPEEAAELAAEVGGLPQLRLRGFMTIGLFSGDQQAVRKSYAGLREVRDSILAQNIPGCQDARQLSMGMSGDFALAIAEGATLVRLGTAIFGARQTTDAYYWPA